MLDAEKEPNYFKIHLFLAWFMKSLIIFPFFLPLSSDGWLKSLERGFLTWPTLDDQLALWSWPTSLWQLTFCVVFNKTLRASGASNAGSGGTFPRQLYLLVAILGLEPHVFKVQPNRLTKYMIGHLKSVIWVCLFWNENFDACNEFIYRLSNLLSHLFPL